MMDKVEFLAPACRPPVALLAPTGEGETVSNPTLGVEISGTYGPQLVHNPGTPRAPTWPTARVEARTTRIPIVRTRIPTSGRQIPTSCKSRCHASVYQVSELAAFFGFFRRFPEKCCFANSWNAQDPAHKLQENNDLVLKQIGVPEACHVARGT